MIIETVFLLFSSCFFGSELFLSLLSNYIDVYTIVGIGSSFGIIFSTWIFFISSLYIPLDYAHGLTHAIILSTTGAIIHFFKRKSRQSKTTSKIPPHVLVISIFLPFLVLAWFIKFSLLYKDNITRGACYGDLPFHLSLISSFTHGSNRDRTSLFDITTPFFAKEKLAYTFIPDYCSAIYVSCFHTSFHLSIILPSFVYAYSIIIVLFKIVLIFSPNDYTACLFAPWLFLFMGGLGFMNFLKYRNEYYIDFVHNWGNGRNEGWFQTIIHILLPQRCSLFSMPIAHSIILILMIVGKPSKIEPMPFIAVGLLVASLPQVQLHSVIAVAQWGIFYVILSFPYRSFKKFIRPYFVNYFVLAVVAALFGFPQVVPFLTRMEKSRNFIQIKPIWKGEANSRNFFTFWTYALGVFFILSIFGRFFFFKILSNDQKKFYDASLLIFVVANFVWYQPWHMDNTKVFNAGWVPLAVALISVFFSKLWKKIRFLGPLLTLFLFILCTLSGFLANFLAAQREYNIWYLREYPFLLAQWITKHTDPKSVWVTDSSHVNPAVCVAGRQTLVGYQGWIASHGLNDLERVRIIRKLQDDPDNTYFVDRLNVSYVMNREQSKSEFYFNPSPDSKFWKKVHQTSIHTIYERTNYKKLK